MKILFLLSVFLFTGLVSCKTDKTYNPAPAVANKTPVKEALQYLALGDSYTIGQSVPANASFPAQLVQALGLQQLGFADPKVIARTGWTTDELQLAINTEQPANNFDLVTLLIGVNNQFRNYSKTIYRREFVSLLNQSITFAKGNKQHVFVLSIPDWGVTPYANGYDRSTIAKEIDQFNAINKEESLKAGVVYVDITAISRTAANDPSLIAEDGLHPSAKMYGLWVKELAPAILLNFK